MNVDVDDSMQIDGEITSSSNGPILLLCAFCRKPFSAPEMYCDHVTDYHAKVPLWHQRFATEREFRNFMQSVEEHRTDRVGYVHPHFHFEFSSMRENLRENYYTFCEETPEPLKRRKLEVEVSEPIVVNCTAFVHVYGYNDGSYMVIYCLDHSCGVASESKANAKANTKCLKRNHESSMYRLEFDGQQSAHSPQNGGNGSPVPPADAPSTSGAAGQGDRATRKNASTCSDPPDMGILLDTINEGLSQAHIKGGRAQSVEAVHVYEAMEVANREPSSSSAAADACPCA